MAEDQPSELIHIPLVSDAEEQCRLIRPHLETCFVHPERVDRVSLGVVLNHFRNCTLCEADQARARQLAFDAHIKRT